MRTDGSRARVLAITNLSLPTESQQKYVPVVVYVGPSGKVFSRPLKDFAGYFPTWLGQDEGASKVIKGLTTPLSAPKPKAVESEDDSIDMSEDDEPVATSAPRAKPTVQVREKVEYKGTITGAAPVVPNLLRAAFQVSNDPNRKTVDATAEKLSRALRVYSQVPDEHLGLVVHKLSFELSPNLTIINLMEVFAPDAWVNTVDAFRIGTPVSDEIVNVDAYIGVYPEYTRNVLYGTVYVGVDMVPVNNQSVQSHVHTEILPEQTAAPVEVQPESVASQPTDAQEDAPVPDPDSVAETPASEEVKTVEATVANDEPVPERSAGEVGQEAILEAANIAESSEPPPDAPPVKVKKKRGPKKKAVELPPVVADDELDVDSLS